jgi:hypothetical protein
MSVLKHLEKTCAKSIIAVLFSVSAMPLVAKATPPDPVGVYSASRIQTGSNAGKDRLLAQVVPGLIPAEIVQYRGTIHYPAGQTTIPAIPKEQWSTQILIIQRNSLPEPPDTLIPGSVFSGSGKTGSWNGLDGGSGATTPEAGGYSMCDAKAIIKASKRYSVRSNLLYKYRFSVTSFAATSTGGVTSPPVYMIITDTDNLDRPGATLSVIL